jgi:hypothetical protein
MAGVKGRSGGRRSGAGAKRSANLVQLHELIDARVGDAVWNSIIDALVKKARQGDVQAFRELRACRYGQIPIAPQPAQGEEIAPFNMIEYQMPCSRKHVDEGDSLDHELSSTKRDGPR